MEHSTRFRPEIGQVQLKAVIGSFFLEFSKFDVQSVGMALRALAQDPVFVEHAEQLLDFEARLKLLERMAFARGMSPALVAELDGLLIRSRRLATERQSVARHAAALEPPATKSPTDRTAGQPAGRFTSKGRGGDYARLAQMNDLLIPTAAQIQEYAAEAIELQNNLRSLSQKFDQQLSAAANDAGAARA